MAYEILGGSIMEVTFEGTSDGQTFMNLFHYWLDEADDLADGKQALLDALNIIDNGGNLLDAYLGCISDQVLDVEIYAQWITPTRYRYVQGPGGPHAGTVASNPYPANVSIAISKQGEQANRHNQGTLHLPAVPLTSVVNSEVAEIAAGAALDDFCTELLLPIVLPGGQDLAPVLFNRANPSESPYIITADWELASRVMRRRTKGVGI